MRLTVVFILAALGFAVSLGFFLRAEAPEEAQRIEPRPDRPETAMTKPVKQTSKGPQVPSAKPEAGAVAERAWQPDPQVISGIKGSLESGDPRAPAIGESIPRATPEDSVLDRPDLYEDFEANQEKKLYRAFVVAAREKEAWLQDEIENARQAGLPDQQLREGAEKLRRIREMRANLENDLSQL